MAKNKRIIILLGIIVALVSFYVGLESWISSKEKPQPPPVVVSSSTKQNQEQPPQESLQKAKEEQRTVPQVQEEKKDVVAEIIKESTKQEQKEASLQETKPAQQVNQKRAVKVYTVQVGAFINKDNAVKALNKAKSMGYSGYIKEEDNFYKVIVKVQTSDIKSELEKLKLSFGGAIVR